jgi:hypothetical protein
LLVVQFTILVLLIGGHVMAQAQADPSVPYTLVFPPAFTQPNSAEPSFAQPISNRPTHVQAVFAQPAFVPATPQAQRVIDKKFVTVMGALGLAEAMRFTTRTLVLEHEEAAGAPWVTSLPSHPSLIAKDAAIFASEVLVAYEMKKRHDWLPGDKIIRKLWWIYPAVMAVPHFKNAVSNIETQAPAGCSNPICQAAPGLRTYAP